MLLSARPATETYTLSLHDALPILRARLGPGGARGEHARVLQVVVALHQHLRQRLAAPDERTGHRGEEQQQHDGERDRKSTRLNSSHSQISYAVFCLKKKKKHRRAG